DTIRHGGDQHLGTLYGLGQGRLGHGCVVEIEAGIEELSHARLDDLRQLARDDHERFLGAVGHEECPGIARAAPPAATWASLAEAQRELKAGAPRVATTIGGEDPAMAPIASLTGSR